PDRIQLAHRAGQPAQDIDLVNRLVDQRAAPFGLPTALDRPRVVFRRPVPLHVTIAFEQLAQASGGDGPPQELAGVVETVLANHTQRDPRAAPLSPHPAPLPKFGGDRFLPRDMLPRLRATPRG